MVCITLKVFSVVKNLMGRLAKLLGRIELYGTGRRANGSESKVNRIPQNLDRMIEGILVFEEELRKAETEFEESKERASRLL